MTERAGDKPLTVHAGPEYLLEHPFEEQTACFRCGKDRAAHELPAETKPLRTGLDDGPYLPWKGPRKRGSTLCDCDCHKDHNPGDWTGSCDCLCYSSSTPEQPNAPAPEPGQNVAEGMSAEELAQKIDADLDHGQAALLPYAALLLEMREALRTIQREDIECGCEHDTEHCCLKAMVFCPRCISHAALAKADKLLNK